MRAAPGESIVVYFQSEAGDTGLFPQAKVYDSAGNVDSTINGTHLANGLYAGTGTAPDDTGFYSIQKIIYIDSGHTTQSGVDPILSEVLEVEFNRTSSSASPNLGMAPPSVKEIAEVFKPFAQQLNAIQIELAKKSEFNAEKTIVRTKEKAIAPSLAPLEKALKDGFTSLAKQLNNKSDFNRLMAAINALPKTFPEIKIPPFPKFKETDLAPVLKSIEELKKVMPQVNVNEILSAVKGIKIDGIDLETLQKIRSLGVLANLSLEIKNQIITAVSNVDNPDKRRVIKKLASGANRVTEESENIKNLIKTVEDKFKELQTGEKSKELIPLIREIQKISGQLSENTAIFKALDKNSDDRTKALMQEIQASFVRISLLLNKDKIEDKDIDEVSSEVEDIQSILAKV